MMNDSITVQQSTSIITGEAIYIDPLIEIELLYNTHISMHTTFLFIEWFYLVIIISWEYMLHICFAYGKYY